MSKIAVINSGSSSIKFKLYEMPQEIVIAHGLIDSIGGDSKTTIYKGNRVISLKRAFQNHKEAFIYLENILKEYKVLSSFKNLDSVGHRVVHGGDKFISSVVVDDEVVEQIELTSKLAPLHNIANLEAIKTIKLIAPNLMQVAVFDTAFHQTMPPEAYLYAIPKSWYQKYGVRRYGFHGSSYRYILDETSKILHKDSNSLNLIVLHLGNGSSVSAIKSGKSIDTSMGVTPLEGLIMGSRSGSIDPSIIFYIHKESGINYEQIETILNKKSGLIAICGENDMRNILRRVDKGDQDAKLAFDIFVRGVAKYIGSYAILLDRVDAIIFSGGIGENSSRVREAICNYLKIFQVELDKELNLQNQTKICTKNSKIKILTIPTDEEIVIARESFKFIKR